MFFGIDRIKRKNFFALCDAVAALPVATRKSLTELTGISYPTVSRALEHLLDMGILKEKSAGNRYEYRFAEKYYISVADLRGKFRMVYCGLGGKEILSFDFKESNAFYYDEKLSLFLRSASIFERKHLAKYRSVGTVLILPSLSEKLHETGAILQSRERLYRLAESYFPGRKLNINTAMEILVTSCEDKRTLVILKEQANILCSTAGYGCNRVSTLKSVTSTHLDRCSSADELAREIAFAVGNMCEVLAPEEILIDGEGLVGISSFVRRFSKALSIYNCVDENMLPRLLHYSGDATVRAGVKLMRNKLISDLINESIGVI